MIIKNNNTLCLKKYKEKILNNKSNNFFKKYLHIFDINHSKPN